ncbi:MAG TPA: hypothetical protein VHT94_07290 [Streptosporangiaceae bacterium]|jgi:hypothetical protein|nr:hypothetical protein [Streptosporangiaceae bacterium]
MAATGDIAGGYGTAQPIPLPLDDPGLAPVLQHWLISAPGFSAAPGGQLVLAVTTLRDLPGFVPAVRHFAAATHEAHLIPIAVTGPPFDPPGVLRAVSRHTLPASEEGASRCQVSATDAEMNVITPNLAAEIVVHGWNPNPMAGPPPVDLWRELAENHLAQLRTARRTGPQAVVT